MNLQLPLNRCRSEAYLAADETGSTLQPRGRIVALYGVRLSDIGCAHLIAKCGYRDARALGLAQTRGDRLNHAAGPPPRRKLLSRLSKAAARSHCTQ